MVTGEWTAAHPSIRENTVSGGDAARWEVIKENGAKKYVHVCAHDLVEHDLVKEGGDWGQRSGGG